MALIDIQSLTWNDQDNTNVLAVGDGAVLNGATQSFFAGNDTLETDNTTGSAGISITGGGNLKGASGDDVIIGEAASFAEHGIEVIDSAIRTGNGLDYIYGDADNDDSTGLYVSNGLIRTGRKADEVYGDGAFHGILLADASILQTDGGADIVEGYADNDSGDFNEYAEGLAIAGNSRLRTGDGLDYVEGYAYADGNGGDSWAVGIHLIDEGSRIVTGSKADEIYGYGESDFTGGDETAKGIDVNAGTFIKMQKGADLIVGEAYYDDDDDLIRAAGIELDGELRMGKGADVVTGTVDGDEFDAFENSFGILIEANGELLTGLGNDTIIAENFIGGYAFWNDGYVGTGKGKDIIDAREADFGESFGGNGTFFLGAGADSVFGWGDGNFDGGKGKFDAIFLPNANGYVFNGSDLSRGGITMNLANFELIGGYNENTIDLVSGTYNVVAGQITLV
jgi:hypothetical protein